VDRPHRVAARIRQAQLDIMAFKEFSLEELTSTLRGKETIEMPLMKVTVGSRRTGQPCREEIPLATWQSLLHHHVNLDTLNLRGILIGENGAGTLKTLLLGTTSLETFVMRGCLIQNRACRTIMQGMASNRSVINADLSRNYLGPRGATAVAEMLCTNSCLERLQLSGNNLQDSGAEAIGQSTTRLRTLCLAENNLNLKGCEEFFHGIRRASNLEILDLSSNYLGDEAVHALAETLHDSTKIRHIYLPDNFIGTRGCEALAGLLERNCFLQTLDLSDAFIPQTTMAYIGKALPNARVERLNLGGNSCGAEDVQAIAQGIHSNTSLQSLVCYACLAMQLYTYCIKYCSMHERALHVAHKEGER
jgi:hypothetical protein